MPSIIMTSTSDQHVLYYSLSILYNDGPAKKQHRMCVFYWCSCRLAFVKDQDTSRISKVMLTTTFCLMLGQHLRLWINMNPALGHRSCTGVQSQSVRNTEPILV